jgi:hypothetical protein
MPIINAHHHRLGCIPFVQHVLIGIIVPETTHARMLSVSPLKYDYGSLLLRIASTLRASVVCSLTIEPHFSDTCTVSLLNTYWVGYCGCDSNAPLHIKTADFVGYPRDDQLHRDEQDLSTSVQLVKSAPLTSTTVIPR